MTAAAAPGSERRRPRVLVLQHDALATLGWLEDVITDVGADIDLRHLWEGAVLPTRIDADAVVSLGGQMSAYADDRHPWLADERRLLADATAKDVPVLGICLGAQVLAAALGGRAYAAPEPEVGFGHLDLTIAGAVDPVLRHLDEPMLLWHGDTFDVPPDGVLLATSPRCPQAFRIRRSLGVQFHPETSPTMLEGWVDALAGEATLPADALDTLVPDAVRLGDRPRECALRLFTAWVEEAGLKG